MKTFYSILFSILLFTSNCAADTFTDDSIKIDKEKLLRYTDTKQESGKSCEEYHYITPMQRLKLIKHKNALFGDILSDALTIENVDPEIIVHTNRKDCREINYRESTYIYDENITSLNSDIVTIKVDQYQYGAGAAHGNGHVSYYVYEREYGMNLKWNEIFGDNNALNQYIFDRVSTEIASPEFVSYFKTSSQIYNFKKVGYFGFTNKGMIIQYGKYEIASGAAGLPFIVIPKAVLAKYMSNEMMAKCFTSNVKYMAKGTYEK